MSESITAAGGTASHCGPRRKTPNPCVPSQPSLNPCGSPPPTAAHTRRAARRGAATFAGSHGSAPGLAVPPCRGRCRLRGRHCTHRPLSLRSRPAVPRTTAAAPLPAPLIRPERPSDIPTRAEALGSEQSRNTCVFDPATAQHRKIVQPSSLGAYNIRSAIHLFCAATEAAKEFI